MGEKKILIIGYYGARNTGDEILLKSTISLLKATYKSSSITAITYSIEDTRERHGIAAVSRNKFLDIVKKIRESDLVIGGGGSIIQNVTSNRSLAYYLVILNLAKLMGKRVALIGNGIGPISGQIPMALAVRVLRKLDLISLRDEESFKILKGQGLKNIHLSSDLAFNLMELKERAYVTSNQKVAINLRNWTCNENVLVEVAEFIRYLVDRGFEVSMVPLQTGNDDLILKKLGEQVGDKRVSMLETIDEKSILKEIGTSTVFIGMRLHSLIFSSILEVPFIALSYDPKVSSFSNSQGQKCFESLKTIKAEDLINCFESVYSNIEDYRSSIRSNLKESEKLSQVNEKLLVDLREEDDRFGRDG